MKWWRKHGINSNDGLALVSLNDRRPFRAYWGLRLTQIVGGERWSLSLVRFQTSEPQLVKCDDHVTEWRVEDGA